MTTEISLLNPNGYPEAAGGGLRRWLADLVTAVAPEHDSFAARLCGDRLIRRFNRDYRNKDRPTDVLSFPGDGEEDPDGQHLGDVVVSVPTARRQAAERSHPPERELRLLLLHGVLHCLGYDHETDDGEMEHVEARLRREWLDRD